MAFPYTLDTPIGTRARLGLIVLQTDETVEHDLRRLLPMDGVSLLATRVPSALEVTGESLAEMEGHLTDAAALFPRTTGFDAVGYACTSGTAVIGIQTVEDQVKRGCQTDHVTNPLAGLIAACRHLGITRLALLSPYVAEVSETLREVLRAAGIETPVFGSFDEAEESKVALIDGPSISAAAVSLAEQGGVDGLFLSCTNLRTLDVIDTLERQTGLPILSSNLVLAWHMARLAGVDLAPGYGRLTP